MGVSKLPAPRVPLSSRGYIDRMDAGLTAVKGAQEIIAMISSRRFVTRLVLGHNELADDGCVVLFKFLTSSVGRKYQIAEISLNSNCIGDRGLAAISDYLQGNQVLKVLFLQDNKFTGDAQTLTSFVTALNASRLELLSFTSNRNLSNPFVEVFLPSLDSPYLREIHLSAIGLTSLAAPHLISYISSPRCRLHTLKCSGNSLGFRAVKAIIRAIERHNFSLLIVEIYANHAVGPVSSDNTSGDDDDEDGVEGPASLDAWKASEAHIRRVLLRNTHLKRETEKEALQLLRYARPLLLTSSGHAPSTRCTDCSCAHPPGPRSGPADSDGAAAPAARGFAFRALPTELQLHIMSFLAPTLSPAQRIRIYTFASSPATLPRAGLCLPDRAGIGSMCVLDPSSMPFGMASGGCAGGKCAGATNSVVCHKEQQRAEWLSAVGCAAYDPLREGDTGADPVQ
ncbi:hypothetical protein B0H15DRAFT_339627 [Mycena belliarum]|uniref:RNI-like protein n=1 Tax=Mycena belliarum TaxID=1033014 RepID=A0AAD6UIR1_9AGAR|nr:hypothetical protein B0H15DRAFT_339627 [Mycena belliae]